jgi:hypothetical protein
MIVVVCELLVPPVVSVCCLLQRQDCSCCALSLFPCRHRAGGCCPASTTCQHCGQIATLQAGGGIVDESFGLRDTAFACQASIPAAHCGTLRAVCVAAAPGVVFQHLYHGFRMGRRCLAGASFVRAQAKLRQLPLADMGLVVWHVVAQARAASACTGVLCRGQVVVWPHKGTAPRASGFGGRFDMLLGRRIGHGCSTWVLTAHMKYLCTV